MNRTWPKPLAGSRPAHLLATPLILTLLASGGCGGTSSTPNQEGRPAFSYDDDEIAPEGTRPREDKKTGRGRR